MCIFEAEILLMPCNSAKHNSSASFARHGMKCKKEEIPGKILGCMSVFHERVMHCDTLPSPSPELCKKSRECSALIR